MSIHLAPAATAAVVTDDPPQYYWVIADVCEPLGERFALFGDDGARVEALRVRADFSSLAGFDAALEEGLRQLYAQPPPSAAPVRLQARAAPDLTTTVLSNIPEGVRVSDVVSADRDQWTAAGAIALSGQVLAAVAALAPVVHGAISAERLILTPRRRVAVLDTGFATALRLVGPTPARLWRTLAIPMPDAAAALSPGAGTDAIQAAIVVLELWLGRRVEMRDASARFPVLIREACERCATVMPASALDLWLRRALAVDEHGYRDAADAFEELIRIPDWPRPADRARALHDLASMWRLHTDGADLPPPATMREVGHQSDADAGPLPVTTTVAKMAAPVSRDIEEKRPRRFERTARTGVVAFCLVALVAAVATAVSRRSISHTIETPPSPVADVRLAAVKPLPSPALVVPPPVSVPLESAAQPVIDKSRRQIIPPAVAGRPRAIAGTPAPQALPHAAPTASPEQPTGIAHFNAIPWANISIDGQPQGQTPLGNVTLPVGSHEVTFAHPDLGTVRRTIVVTADRPTRLSVTLGGEP